MIGIVLSAGAFFMLYAPVVMGLVRDWDSDANYSHGYFIVPIAVYIAWQRRGALAAAAHRPAAAGLAVIALGLGMLTAGVLGAEVFLARISMIVTLTGGVVFLFGWARCRALAFPLAFLVLMVPLPALVFNQIALPLQLLASRVGEAALTSAGIPVLREGNVLILTNITLQVAEACSGIRSLISLLTLGIVLGYFADHRRWVRLVIALSTIPVAVVANAARVAGVGLAAHRFGAVAAEGFLHEASGWMVFVVAFALIAGIQQALARVAPASSAPRLAVGRA